MADYPDWTELVNIVGTDIMVAIDLQGAYIMMPVDIQAQYLTLEIDIVAQTVGNIAIDLAAQSVGAISVDITAQTIAQLDINIDAQNVGVYLQPDWQVKAGTYKNFYATGSAKTGGQLIYVSYTVTTGKTLYITGFSFAMTATTITDYDHHLYVQGYLYDSTAGTFFAFSAGLGGSVASLTQPIAFTSGHLFQAIITNFSNIACEMKVNAWGYEI
jgi:hypothetical protein